MTNIAILCAESVAHLESLMRLYPDAIEWRYILGVSMFGNEIEEGDHDFVSGRWSTTWPTMEGATAKSRLTPPAGNIAELVRFLSDMQLSHSDATGGPLDGLYFQVEVKRMQTRLSIR